MTISPKPRNPISSRIALCLSLLAAGPIAACEQSDDGLEPIGDGDGDGDNTTNGSGDGDGDNTTNGSGDGDGDNTTNGDGDGDGDAIGGAGGGDNNGDGDGDGDNTTNGDGDGDGDGDAVSSWLVGHWTTDTAGAYLGSLVVVDDLSKDGSVNLSKAKDFATDITYSVMNNETVFVGRKAQPNLQRFEVKEDDTLELTGEIAFDFYGVTDTMGRSQPVIQFIDEEHALYIDMPTLKVFVFNPMATPMTIYEDQIFSIEGLQVEGEDAPTVSPSAVHAQDDRVYVVARYYSGQLAAPLTRVAIIDLETLAVTYAENTECGNVANSAEDADGNVYFGSHPAQAVYNAAGLVNPDSPPSCIIRINKGEDDFDPSYFVNLEEISGGGTVGSLLPGINGYAYLLEYTKEIPTDPPLTAGQARGLLTTADWQLHLIELDDPESSYAEMENVSLATGYASGFLTIVGKKQVPYLILPGDELRQAYYWDVSDPSAPVRALGFAGTPGSALPLK